MLITKEYDRARAVMYARRWAFSRNPLFYDFTGGGGNCTNFVSQCLYAGTCIMNPTPNIGWYYNSINDRAPAWTGVRFLYEFLVTNRGVGPFGREVSLPELFVGDVIQLGREETGYYHTLLVTGAENDVYLVAAQSDDALDRPLDTYDYDYARYIHIEGARIEVTGFRDCFPSLYDGTEIVYNGKTTEE